MRSGSAKYVNYLNKNYNNSTVLIQANTFESQNQVSEIDVYSIKDTAAEVNYAEGKFPE